jgi:hypothetical protein
MDVTWTGCERPYCAIRCCAKDSGVRQPLKASRRLALRRRRAGRLHRRRGRHLRRRGPRAPKCHSPTKDKPQH